MMMRTALTVVILFASLSGFAVASTPATRPIEPAVLETPNFGLSVVVPLGWSRAQEDGVNQAVRLVLIESGKVAVEARVAIGPADLTPRQGADKIAAGGPGAVASDAPPDFPIGSAEVTLQPLRDPRTGELKSLHIWVLQAKRSLVVVSVIGVDAGKVARMGREIAASIKFSDPAPCSDNLELRSDPIHILDTRLVICLPEPFRPVRVKDQKQEQKYSAHDLINDQDEASVEMSFNPNAVEVGDLDKFMADVAASITRKIKPDKPLTFQRVSADPPVYLSNIVTPTAADPQRLLYLKDGDRSVGIFFRCGASDQAVRDKYFVAAEKMAASIKRSDDDVTRK